MGLSPLAAAGQDDALVVKGEVSTPLKPSLGEIQGMASAKVKVTDHDGSAAEYEGVWLHEILRRAGLPEEESLRGPALQLCVSVKAADNYKVAFSLAELDPMFGNRQVLVAYQRNGAPLDAKTGPLRLVIPDESRQARWVCQVRELEIVRLESNNKP